jgi:hypothetical protein
MNIRDTLRGVLRRLPPQLAQIRRALGTPVLAGTGAPEKRRTLALPSILQTYGPRADVLPKPTPYNLRRFAETPIARKAINTLNDRVAGMRWRIQPKNGRSLDEVSGGADRVRILTDNLDAPNSDDSFRSLAEQVLEDVIVGGFGAIEVEATGDSTRPLNLWPVDGASIRMRTDWNGSPDSPRYVQVAGVFSPNTQNRAE